MNSISFTYQNWALVTVQGKILGFDTEERVKISRQLPLISTSHLEVETLKPLIYKHFGTDITPCHLVF